MKANKVQVLYVAAMPATMDVVSVYLTGPSLDATPQKDSQQITVIALLSRRVARIVLVGSMGKILMKTERPQGGTVSAVSSAQKMCEMRLQCRLL